MYTGLHALTQLHMAPIKSKNIALFWENIRQSLYFSEVAIKFEDPAGGGSIPLN